MANAKQDFLGEKTDEKPVSQMSSQIQDPGKKQVPEKGGASKKYTVTGSFRDKNNFDNMIEPGTDVSDFDPARLKKLIALNLVKVS